jgi:hypothetical protein
MVKNEKKQRINFTMNNTNNAINAIADAKKKCAVYPKEDFLFTILHGFS